MVDFAGWEMPLLYSSIVEEHHQTRRSGAIFDVSHMGRLRFTGQQAAAFLDHVLTRNVAALKTGQSRYSLVCNPAGGIMDDVIVSRHVDGYMVVCNASNREKIFQHFTREARRFDVLMRDMTVDTAMVAIQGPRVIDLLSSALDLDLRSLKRYGCDQGRYLGVTPFTVFRSGYTGEDGIELIFPASAVSALLEFLQRFLSNPRAEIRAAGLGARDTLRMEAGMPLYGHELSEQTDPLSAGLGWAVDLNKPFIGREALAALYESGPPRRLAGLILDGARIARQGADVLHQGQSVGEATSGTRSPTLNATIAMALIRADVPADATLEVDLRGARTPARQKALPFYRRPA